MPATDSLPIESILSAILKKHLVGFIGFDENGGESMLVLGMDSLQAISILLDIEEALGEPLPEDSITSSVFESPNTLLHFIVKNI